MFFEYNYSFFLRIIEKRTALFAHLWKNTYVCTIFCAVTYKVTAFFLIKISNKKSGENVFLNILPAFKIYRYFSTFQVFVPVLLPENRKI